MELIIQKPAFNTSYFTIGQAVRVFNNNKKDVFDGLIISIDSDRLGIVKVKWISPMTGISHHEAITDYLYVDDFKNDKYTIERL